MEFRKKTVRDVDIIDRVVLVRVDYNVPMKDGEVADDMRIVASLPTIKYLIENKAAKIILMSHLGRPDGEVKPELSLAPVAKKLAELLPEAQVDFVDETVGDKVKEAVANMPEQGVLLLENLRFSPLEEENSSDFAKQIIESTGAELFVQDGFSVIHRAHASTDAIARELNCVAGFLVEKEVSALEAAISDPEHPVLVIIGGAKVEDKEPLIKEFLPIADQIVVGGKIAADGYDAGEYDKIYVAEGFIEDEEGRKLDIDSASAAKIVGMIANAKTIVWNGTMGMAEDPKYAIGSYAVGQAIGHKKDALTIIGGGDTAGYVQELLKESPDLEFSLVSTGGGASLELLSGKELPGLEVLRNR